MLSSHRPRRLDGKRTAMTTLICNHYTCILPRSTFVLVIVVIPAKLIATAPLPTRPLSSVTPLLPLSIVSA